MYEKHNIFNNANAAQAMAAQLSQITGNQGEVSITTVDQFLVNDCTADPGNPEPLCNLINGPYYVVSVIA
jgi:hypothetical protein